MSRFRASEAVVLRGILRDEEITGYGHRTAKKHYGA
jgi:hypothetical protein